MNEFDHDPVNHPKHYAKSGIFCPDCGHEIEAIEVTEHFSFVLGNTLKYIWRAGKKEGAECLQDLKKAQWYINRAVSTLEKEQQKERVPYAE